MRRQNPFDAISLHRNDYIEMLKSDISDTKLLIDEISVMLEDTKALLERAKRNHGSFKLRRALRREIHHYKCNLQSRRDELYRLQKLLYLFSNV